MKKIKILVIGEFGVGKTALIKNYLNMDFQEFYEPTYEDVYKK
jgi:GTPase SAR1 family protein